MQSKTANESTTFYILFQQKSGAHVGRLRTFPRSGADNEKILT